MKLSDSKILPRARAEINPAWVTAEYEVDFAFHVVVPSGFYDRTRKRRRHWMRQLNREFCKRVFRPPPRGVVWDQNNYLGESKWINNPPESKFDDGELLLIGGFPMAALLSKK